MSNYNTLTPEVETPHAKDFRVQSLKQLTEQHGPDYVRSERPELLYAAEVVNGAISAFGMEWLERHYPAHAKHYRAKSALLDDFFDGAVTAELQRIQSRAAKAPAVVKLAVLAPVEKPEPAAPVVAAAEVPKVSISADCLMPDLAPAFRGDIARMPQLITRDEHRNVLAERRVVDLVYLHRIGFRPTLDTSLVDGRFRELMTGDTLDLALVREFAKIVSSKTSRWSDEHLAEKVLFIPANLQVQLCQLVTDRIKRGRARVYAEEAATRVKLERSLRQSGDAKLIRHVPLWARLWLCDTLIKLAVNRRSPQEVSLLLKAMTGQDMSRSDVAKKLKTIDRHVT